MLPLIVSLTDDIFDMEPFHRFGITPHDLCLIQKRRLGHQKPSRRRWKLDSEVFGAKNAENRGFEMNLDVRDFKPEEITVKTVDNHIVVEAKHEEHEDDNSFISRHFVRRCALPEDCNIQEAVSTLSADGVLTVKAPPKAIESKEHIIEIQRITDKSDKSPSKNAQENQAKAA
uniref:Putative alpha crystallin n=1 Tax=Lutzomyia longipalpis TaxID=7200 RepID=A0A7G3A9I1_LUTLO